MNHLTLAKNCGTVRAMWCSAAVALVVLSGCAHQPYADDDNFTHFGSYLAARHASSQNDHAASSQYWENVLDHSPDDTDVRRSLMRSHLAGGSSERAVEQARIIVDAGVIDSSAHLILGIKALAEGNYGEAREHLSSARLDPIDALLATILDAWSYTLAGDLDAGLQALDQLATVRRFDLYRLYHAGLMRAFANPQADNPDLEKAYELAGAGSVRTAQIYADYLIGRQQVDDAIAVLQAANTATQRHPVIEAALKRVQQARRAPQQSAQGTASDAASTAPMLIADSRAAIAETLYSIAGAISGPRLADRALQYLRLANHVHTPTPLTLLLQAEVYDTIDRPRKALEVYAKVAGFPGMEDYAAEHQARALQDLGNQEGALELIDEYIAQKPASARLWTAKGDLLRIQGKWNQAAAAFSEALKHTRAVSKSDWTIYFARAIAYERDGQWKKAESDLLQALRLEPDHPDVLNYLGYSWIDQGINLRRGFALIKRAVELRPHSGAIVDSLGWAYYRIRRYDEALNYLERAVQMRPQDSVINDHLGDVYWRVGRRLEAEFQWSHAIDLQPDTAADLERIEQKLRRAERVNRGMKGPSPLPSDDSVTANATLDYRP